jgi:hypothetical protein
MFPINRFGTGGSQSAHPHPTPPSSTRGKAGRNHLKEEIPPSPYCRTISNLEHEALLRQCKLPL